MAASDTLSQDGATATARLSTRDNNAHSRTLAIAAATNAANAAAAAFPGWSATGPSERRRLLNRAGDVLAARTREITDTMTSETGATADWGMFNVDLAVKILRDAAAMTTQLSGEVIPSDQPGVLALNLRKPAGVCLGIAPWNAPVILGIRAIAMPLACGNTVVLKASELCPRTHILLGDIMHEAGFGAGIVNVVTNEPVLAHDVVQALIASPVVRRVNFTGSTRVGRMVAEISARHLKKCLLELGGKAPFIVLGDADIDEAVKAASFGAFMNQGQICMSTERIILIDTIADEFVEKFRAHAAALPAGDPGENAAPLGAMISSEAAARVGQLVEDAVDKGASVLVGGRPRGRYLDATVIDHVSPAMRIYHEESFGPLATIIRVASPEQAVTVANDCEYGLAAAVFGADMQVALAVAQQIESGICHINSTTVADEPQIPFGGMKSSGYGRFGGRAAIDEFTETQWITMSSKKGSYPI